MTGERIGEGTKELRDFILNGTIDEYSLTYLKSAFPDVSREIIASRMGTLVKLGFMDYKRHEDGITRYAGVYVVTASTDQERDANQYLPKLPLEEPTKIEPGLQYQLLLSLVSQFAQDVIRIVES
jgi:hypothetical protein